MLSALNGEIEVSGERVMLRLTGSLCLANEDLLRRCMDGVLALEVPPRCLTVDLRDVEFIDSTGLRALLTLRSRAVGAGMALIVVPGKAADRLIRLLDLERFFEFQPGSAPTSRPAEEALPRPASFPVAG